MADRLPLPKELQLLMEKRETAERRRRERRKATEAAIPTSAVPLFTMSPKPDETKTADPPSNATPSRRKKTDRRDAARRKTDKK